MPRRARPSCPTAPPCPRPARACDTAVFASHSRVASLSTCPHHRSAMPVASIFAVANVRHHSSSGTARLTARTARCVIPCSAYAPLALRPCCRGCRTGSLRRRPGRTAPSHSCTSSSTENCAWPGMERIGVAHPSPGQTNSGKTIVSGSNEFLEPAVASPPTPAGAVAVNRKRHALIIQRTSK